MAQDSHASPEGPPRPSRGWWRLGTPLVVLACGALFVTSASNSQGTDLRPGRYTDLASLVAAENAEYQGLTDRLQALNADVERLTRQVGNNEVDELQDQVGHLKGAAGMTPVTGPGLTVTLSDAPADVINSTTRDLELLIVHQQDIQAVANALWKGGAEAMTIQGERVVSTTGIKCEGNAVMLQGVAYPQPYVISAIGNPAALEAAVSQDDYLDVYRMQASLPDVSVGWEMRPEGRLDMPAYDGLTSLSYAEPLS
jgi:uncharacterized protein YlxW (UPF0749 family)